MSNLNSVVMVKMVGSGLKVISVPVPLDLPMTSSFCVVTPRANSMGYTLPSRDTSTLNQSDSALTHLAPTPCKPPEYL